MESIENIQEFHNFVAQSMITLTELIANKKNVEAKDIMRCNILYAHTIWLSEMDETKKPEDVIKEMMKWKEKVKLDDMDIPELYITMTAYQVKVGIKPTQHIRFKAGIWNSAKDGLQE